MVYAPDATGRIKRAQFNSYDAVYGDGEDDDLYPNGVRRGVWDERLPSGRSAMNIGLSEAMQGMLDQATIGGQQGGFADGTGKSGRGKPRKKRSAAAPTLVQPTGAPPPQNPQLPQLIGAKSEGSALESLGAPPPTPRLTQAPQIGGVSGQLPDGRTPSQVVQDLGVTGQPPPPGGPVGPNPPDVHLGTRVTPGMNRIGRKIAELEQLSKSDFEVPVKRTEWGYEEQPPEKSPSRWKQAGLGALQGALAGAERTGTLAGALGGAGVGAASGGISPRLMMAFTRAQDIRRAQGELSNDLGLEQQRAQVGGLEASAEYQRQRPYLEAAEIQRKLEQEQAVLEQRRAEEQGRTARAEQERRNRIDVANIRSRGSNSSTAIADEGDETVRQAEAAESELKAELDDLRGPTLEGERSIAQKDALWKARAAQIVKEAADNFENITQAEALARAQAEDPHYTSGIYDETVKNTEAKRARIKQIEAELLDIAKERRGGAAKGARRAKSTGGGEDPQVRRYADKFFGGDYAKAEQAIKQQRGQ